MEKTAENRAAIPISLVRVLLFLVVLNKAVIVRDLCSGLRSMFLIIFVDFLFHALQICGESRATCAEAPMQRLCINEDVDDKKVSREEETVLQAKRMNPNGADPTGPKLHPSEKVEDNKLSIGEVKIVMEKLGTLCELDDENSQERIGLDEIAGLFDEEPSPEEVKEAFDMFDKNNDGFIDAGELGKVLSTLGVMEPSEVECQRMIRVFDDNGDGRIDFQEFVKILEPSFV